VVARDHPGSRFLLSDGRGIIAEDKSVESLALALRHTMAAVESRSPAMQDQIALGQRFVTELTPDHIGQQWRRAINGVVNAKLN
jgi:glycosyltransferase involved in cell wall biosynthesis